MLKVMHVTNSRQYSGGESVVITIISNTRENIKSAYVSPYGSIKYQLAKNDISYFPVERLSCRELKRVYQKIKPNIIHAHDFTASIMSVITFGDNVPIISHLHNNAPWIKHYNLRSFVYGLSCFFYKKILTVSKAIMDEYIFGNWFKDKVNVIGNPIDISRIRNLAGCFFDNHYDVAFLGRLSLPKNPFLFLNIINEVRKHKNDVSVVIIGDGELRQEVDKKIRDLQLENNIKLLGFQNNPYILLNQAKILCMPSLWEGFGLAAVEALALGKPVICSGAGGLSDIVNNSCGKICTDIAEYNQEILQLINDSVYYNKKSQGAIRRSRCFDNLRQYIDNINKIYREI